MLIGIDTSPVDFCRIFDEDASGNLGLNSPGDGQNGFDLLKGSPLMSILYIALIVFAVIGLLAVLRGRAA